MFVMSQLTYMSAWIWITGLLIIVGVIMAVVGRNTYYDEVAFVGLLLAFLAGGSFILFINEKHVVTKLCVMKVQESYEEWGTPYPELEYFDGVAKVVSRDDTAGNYTVTFSDGETEFQIRSTIIYTTCNVGDEVPMQRIQVTDTINNYSAIRYQVLVNCEWTCDKIDSWTLSDAVAERYARKYLSEHMVTFPSGKSAF